MREKKLFQLGLILPIVAFVIMSKIFDMSHPGKWLCCQVYFWFKQLFCTKGESLLIELE